MLYKILGKLFRDDNIFRYTPKPWHLAYSLLLMAVGTVTMGQGWTFFGFMSSLFGVILGLTIILGMNWDKSIEYWDVISRVFTEAAKIKDAATRYEMLKSMGYQVPNNRIEIIETKKDDAGVYAMDKTIIKGISPAVLQLIADKVLMSGKSGFAEDDYSQFIPAIRKVRKAFKDANIIAPNNPGNVRLGYSFTKKGIDTLYEYASEGVKLDLKRTERR